MAQREVAIKVRLRPEGFLSGLRKMKTASKSAGISMGAALSKPIAAGMKAAKASMAGMMTTLKGTIKTAATLGGVFALGGLVKSAVGLQTQFRNIAFNINKVSGNTADWLSLQREVEAVANKTGTRTEDLAEAFDTVFKATGNLEFAKSSLEAIGTASTATGESTQNLAKAAELLNRKFGITSQDLPDALTRFIEKTGVGGKGLDELTGRFGILATEAVAAGLKGSTGVSQLLGLFQELDNEIGEKADPALKLLFQTLKNGTTQLESFAKKGKIKFDVDDTAFDKVLKILKSEEGRKEAEKLITADARIVFDKLAKPFDDAVKTAKEAGVTGKALEQVGIDAFNQKIEGLSKSSLKFTKIQDEAARRVEDDPAVALRQAINKVKTAFTQEKMQEAISSLASNLPALAEGIAKLVDVVVNNPLLSLGGFVGGRAALSAGAGFAGSAASGLAGAGAGVIRTQIQKRAVGAAIQSGLSGLAASSGASFATAAAGSSKWALAGSTMAKIAGPLMGAAVAFTIGKELIDAGLKEGQKTLESGEASIIAAGAAGTQNVATKRVALEKLKEKRAELEPGPSKLSSFFSNLSEVSASVGLSDKVKTALEQNVEAYVRVNNDITELEAAIAKQTKGGRNSASANERLAKAANKAATALGNIAPTGAPGGGGGPEQGPAQSGGQRNSRSGSSKRPVGD